jgi:hypothetical protein
MALLVAVGERPYLGARHLRDDAQLWFSTALMIANTTSFALAIADALRANEGLPHIVYPALMETAARYEAAAGPRSTHTDRDVREIEP